MKTNYNTPEIMICSMDDADIIATSNYVPYSGSNLGGPTAAEGNERDGNPIWDD